MPALNAAFRHTDVPRFLLWVPLVASSLTIWILVVLRIAPHIYMALLTLVVLFDLLALFGPRRWQAGLFVAAPPVYAGVLLLAWINALYVLPTHPTTPMTRTTVELFMTVIYVSGFLRYAPGQAVRRAGAFLGLLLATLLPYSLQTYRAGNAVDSLFLPFVLLFTHSALIAVLWSFSQAREQLVQAQAREAALSELAHRDPLTGLHNRRALDDDLEKAGPRPLLAVIDIDGLKAVNDAQGHQAGDDLLRHFAAGFVQAAAQGDRVYRLGGDEFALLLGQAGPEAARRLVEHVTARVRAIYPEAGASVGAVHRHPHETVAAWFTRADRAMYAHKAQGQPDRPPPEG
ncbi:GGDEF domain-containing protein [Deinococcus gobiensis]|uniref:Diguanylate cyclase, putative n=1 Tax=Deinococcus gobiensis (strain DSM 21396 / JCM 16679 / CGMCC 1.7299 / I-0) TaxID=745776 RepID=H8H0Q0_DEIGI|nr:GGDEF domain-containing protein [Deinococcus gobiensis]AFD26919.1 Diguanylate cyclase, putative [Deinococcus gobiensis I-0]